MTATPLRPYVCPRCGRPFRYAATHAAHAATCAVRAPRPAAAPAHAASAVIAAFHRTVTARIVGLPPGDHPLDVELYLDDVDDPLVTVVDAGTRAVLATSATVRDAALRDLGAALVAAGAIEPLRRAR